jgi:DNA sulfur modification protein DndD
MWLERVSVKDFRCFHGEHSVDFSVDPNRNVTLIHAENGVGKTTLLNAMLWCFYSMTTPRFERKEDLVNYDAVAEGRTTAFVEVTFRHNDTRYRARRFAGRGVGQERAFTIMRLDKGSSKEIDNPDTFINTVIPKGMANHFLFDGEHAEGFMGEDNRGEIRRAVQDILGCTLIETAIKDLNDAATHYRKQVPKTKASTAVQELSDEVELLEGQAAKATAAKDGLEAEVAAIEQHIADIEGKLRTSSAAKELQARRDGVSRELDRATKREEEARDDVLKWLGDNGRFLVSTRITELAFDHLHQEETKGKLPSPYNEEFVTDLLEMHKCICGAELLSGTPAYDSVASLLHKAANATLRSRLTSINARLSSLKSGRMEAPAKLEAANRRLAAAREDISRCEADQAEISDKLQGIDFDEISERERRRNELRREANQKREAIGEFKNNISRALEKKANAERELKRIAETDAGAKIFVARYALCESLRDKIAAQLREEEESARSVLRSSIRRILEATSRKSFRLNMTDDYTVSLVNDAGTQLPKSGGENQLLGLAFTAALVEFAKAREHAEDHMLLKGTVAPLVLDSPFGQLDESYRQTTAGFVPKMAQQVVLMISGSQGASGVLTALHDRIGKEYALVRYNKAERGTKAREFRQFYGRDYELAHFDSPFDGSAFEEIVR